MGIFRRRDPAEPTAARAGSTTAALEARLAPQDVRERIVAAAPTAAEHLLATQRTAGRLAVRRADDATLPAGTPKLGGLPDLAPGTPWPTWTDPRSGTTRALTFFAQIDLGAFAGADLGVRLPSSGLLSAFADVRPDGSGITGLHREEHRGALLVHAPPSRRLERVDAPAGTPVLATGEVLPLLVTSLDKDGPPGVEVPDAELAALDGALAAMAVELAAALPPGWSLSGAHQVGGHPDRVDGPVEASALAASAACFTAAGTLDPARWAAVAAQAAGWRAVLQIDSDEALDLRWGDAGTLWWSLPPDDLRAGRWDQAWLTFQDG